MNSQTILSNKFIHKKYMGVIMVLMTLVIFFLIWSHQFSGNLPMLAQTSSPNPMHFEYRLEVSPKNFTLLQGNNVQINVTTTHLNGSAENIKLSIVGIPDGATYSLSEMQPNSTNNSRLSTLIIHVSKSVPTNSYPITINSNSNNSKTVSSVLTLTVLSAEILVSGTIDGGINVLPKQIFFRQLSASGSSIQTFATDVEEGQYIISLPNKQFYAVGVVWEGLDDSFGTQHFIQPYGVNAGVGITSINCPFSWYTPTD